MFETRQSVAKSLEIWYGGGVGLGGGVRLGEAPEMNPPPSMEQVGVGSLLTSVLLAVNRPVRCFW